MKKTILFIGITLFVFSAKAQTVYVPSGTSGIGTSSNANVGIGTSTPEAKLSMHTQDYDESISSTYPTASSRGDIVQFIETSNNGIEIGNGRGVNDRKAWILARHTDLDYIQYGTFYSTLHLQPNVGNKTNYMGVAIGYGADTSLTVGTHLAVNGKVGIGTTAPLGMFQVYGDDAYLWGINLGYGTSIARITTDDSTKPISFQINNTEYMRLSKEGNVGIGTTDPQYKLDVKGQIRATEVLIQSVDSFADFVFDKNYRLPALNEVKAYINDNGHLPEIPSAKEVKENGMNLVEMQVKLLQKVEELTLYTIKQQEEIKLLKEKLEKLGSEK